MNFLRGDQENWDLVLLNEVPETSPHIPWLFNLSHLKGWYCEKTEVPCAFVNLPTDWETYLRSLKPRMRSKIRSLTRKLQQNFQVTFSHCQQEGELLPQLQSLFDLHSHRWQEIGREGVFVSRFKRTFYEKISDLFLSRGWLRFYSLAVNDQHVAHQFCFEYRDTLFLLQEGYDPEWTQNGVGNVLRAYIFRDCIERKVPVYDFLAGVTPHKLSWGSLVKNSLRFSIGPKTFKNIIFFELPKAIRSGKTRLKTIIPQSLLEKANSLRKQ